MNEEENRRLIQEKIAKMLREGILEASNVEDGEPLLGVTDKGLLEKVEAEIADHGQDKKEVIAILIDKFLKSDSSYGEITNIEGDVQSVYNLTRDYLCEKGLDVCAIRFQDKILLSRTSFEFEDILKAVHLYSILIAKKDIIELWDDSQNKILHLLILPLRKHFPIGYTDEKGKLETIQGLSVVETKST